MLKSENRRYAFRRGWLQVPLGAADDVKMKIMFALGIKTRVSWYNRLSGSYYLSPAERDAIANIFAEYGITDVWGEE